jgi:hypothetical protein
VRCFSRNVNVEIRGAARDYIKRSAESRYTTPYEIVRRVLSLLAAVDQYPDADIVLVDRITGETLKRYRQP